MNLCIPVSGSNKKFMNQDIANLTLELEQKLLSLRKSKILITGSSGLLGFYFSNFFLFANKQLNLNMNITLTGRSPLNLSFNDYNYVQGDLLDNNFISNFEIYDCILNLAGVAQPILFMRNPSATMRINTEVCNSLLQKLDDNGTFLYISSSEVYTNSKLTLSSESDLGFTAPSNPRAIYIYSKLLGESICNSEIRNSNKNIKIARLASVYGPGFRIEDQRVMSSFILQAIVNNKINLLDQGNSVREYLYISDAIKSLFNLTFFGGSSLYNVGAGKQGSISIIELAKKISLLTNATINLPDLDSNPLHASNHVGLDITKYKGEFGELYKVSLDEGLQRTISWTQHLID